MMVNPKAGEVWELDIWNNNADPSRTIVLILNEVEMTEEQRYSTNEVAIFSCLSGSEKKNYPLWMFMRGKKIK